MVDAYNIGNIVIIDIKLLIIVYFLLEIVEIVTLVHILEEHFLHGGATVSKMFRLRVLQKLFLILVLKFLFGMLLMIQNL